MKVSRAVTRTNPIVIKVGNCIYCRHHNTDGLTREHVMPNSIGGGIILLDASCEHHRKITHKFETTYIGSLRSFRYVRNLPSYRPKNVRPKHLPLYVEHGFYIEQRSVSLDQYPDILALPVFDKAPGILTQEKPDTVSVTQMRLCMNRNDLKSRMEKLGISNAVIPGGVPVEEFVRTIAKIAHGLAVTWYGLHFEPTLLEIIEGDLSFAGFLIGAAKKEMTAPMHPMSHLYGRRLLHADNLTLIVIDLKLFTEYSPTYCLIAGIFERDKRPPNPAWPEIGKYRHYSH